MVGVRWDKARGVLSRRRFLLVKCGLWIYALALLAALVIIYFLWTAPLIWRILINVLMIFTTPYPKDLLMNYDEYLMRNRAGQGVRAGAVDGA